MNKPIVVNLFGPPGCGKSTGAAYIFAMLKMHGVNCELVTEFAKDKIWEHNTTALNDQAYVFGKQCYRISRCADQVDVIVTDSPLLLSVIYNNSPVLGETFNKTVLDVFNSYSNLNYMLRRVKPYNTSGRNQTEEESDNLENDIENMLTRNSIDFKYAAGDIDGYHNVFTDILENLNKGEMTNETEN